KIANSISPSREYFISREYLRNWRAKCGAPLAIGRFAFRSDCLKLRSPADLQNSPPGRYPKKFRGARKTFKCGVLRSLGMQARDFERALVLHFLQSVLLATQEGVDGILEHFGRLVASGPDEALQLGDFFVAR